jgi:hypothetical protein
MSISTLAFVFIVLFMVHEFEEICLRQSWLDKNRANPEFKKELWVSQSLRHPTNNSAFAFMIAEEFVLAVVLLFVAIGFDVEEIMVGLYAANALHLVGHLVDAMRFKKWTPGSVTALVVLLVSSLVLWLAFNTAQLTINISLAVVCTLATLAALAINLKLLYDNANNIERHLDAISRRFY